MCQWPQNIEQTLTNPTNFYILMTIAIVFIYQQQNSIFATIWAIFISVIASESIIVEKSGRGNNIYLFCKINFLLLVNLLKTCSYTYRYHQSIIKKNFWVIESKFFPCYAVKNLQYWKGAFQGVGVVIKKYLSFLR